VGVLEVGPQAAVRVLEIPALKETAEGVHPSSRTGQAAGTARPDIDPGGRGNGMAAVLVAVLTLPSSGGGSAPPAGPGRERIGRRRSMTLTLTLNFQG
jgi:hypothetical protein